MKISATLTRKIGPLPAWAWGTLLVVVAYVIYRRRRNSGAGTTNAPSTSGAPNYPGGAEIVTGNTAQPSAQDAAMSGQPSTNYPPGAMLDQSTLDSLFGAGSPLVTGLEDFSNSAYLYGINPGGPNAGIPAEASGGGGVNVSVPTPAAHTGGLTPVTTKAKSKPAVKAPAKKPPKPHGGIVSKVKLKSGATVTTYASGRKVEQAPGHRSYVIHK